MAKIGIFDSGAGGLSVYREIRKLLPGEHFIYVSDSAHCPYGEKTREYIIGRARYITDFLLEKGCEAVVVACNTATAAAIDTLRASYDIPFIGMEPAVKPAALSTKTGVVGVLATAGTLKASKYIDTRDRYADGVEVIEHVGEGFVELVESGILTGEQAEETVRASVKPLVDAGADIIVLGCTHYPFLRDTIAKVASELAPDRKIEIIDPAPAAARHLVNVLKDRGIELSSGFEAVGSSDSGAAADDGLELYTTGSLVPLRRIYDLL